jgi:molybdate transport system ATP-binding protein
MHLGEVSLSETALQDAAHLRVQVGHRQGGLALNVAFALTQPWTVLFGPSGSGKTTVLRTIAGFVRPDKGSVLFGPTDSVLLSTDERIFVPAHERPVRSAAQTARLFPHKSVLENVAYGLGWRSHPEDGRQIIDELAVLLRLSTLLERMPEKLSGGERQRVSVARAVVAAVTFDGPGKALLLLDEPFAGLDVVLRDELAIALQGWLARWKVPVLSVSHDIEECFLLGAEVVRLAEGEVMEQGPVRQVLARERERLLSRLDG